MTIKYDKALESGLIVSLEEISLILRRRHSLRRAAKFRPMLGAYGLWEGRDLHRITPVIRGLGLRSHPKDHRLEQTVDTVDAFQIFQQAIWLLTYSTCWNVMYNLRLISLPYQSKLIFLKVSNFKLCKKPWVCKMINFN